MDHSPIGRRRLLATGGALALASLAGCTARALPGGRRRFSAREVDRFDTAAIETLTVTNNVGDVVVGRHAESHVAVSVQKRANDRETLDRLGVEIALDEGALSVRTTYPSRYLRRTEDGPRSDVTVLFPAASPGPVVESVSSIVGDVTVRDVRGDVRARSRVGSVVASQVDGFIDLRTEMGDVEAAGCTGLDHASTSTGSVKAELLGLREDVLVESGVGAVVLGIDPTLDLDLWADGTDVDVDAALPLSSRTGGGVTGFVAGRLNDGGPRVLVQAGLGEVDVTALE
jgi:hypothetical protein